MLPDLHPDNDAVFFDIDGTLIDLAATPDEVVVPPNLVCDLEKLYHKLGGALAIVSGRSLETIETLFHPLKLPSSGAHGAESQLNDKLQTKPILPYKMRKSLTSAFTTLPGIIVEDKKHSIAVHYRQSPELKDNIYEILKKLVSAEKQIRILPGKKVFEVTYTDFNKGNAIVFFMAHEPFINRRPIFIGDDETDKYAIETCEKLGGYGIWVGKNNASRKIISPADIRNWIEKQVA